MLPRRQIERLDRDTGHRMGGDFQRTQAHGFEQLQHDVIRRRFHRDGIARLRNSAQAQGHRFGAGIGDDDFLVAERAPPLQGAAGDGANQRRFVQIAVARPGEQVRLTARHAAVKAAEPLRQQEFRCRQRRAKRHHAARFVGPQHFHQTPANADRHRLVCRRGQHRLGHARHLAAHVIAGLRPGFDQPARFEHPQSLHHRRDRQGALLRQVPHRGQAIAGFHVAVADQRSKFGREGFVKHHGENFRVNGHRARGTVGQIIDQHSQQKPELSWSQFRFSESVLLCR